MKYTSTMFRLPNDVVFANRMGTGFEFVLTETDRVRRFGQAQSATTPPHSVGGQTSLLIYNNWLTMPHATT